MDTQKVHIDVEGVTLGGVDQKVGAVVELGAASAQVMIAEGKARAVDAEGNPVDAGDPTEAPAADTDEAAAEVEKQKKALADQYNLEPGSKPGLKDAAAAAGVDFAYDVTKGDLIDLIVAQGKAAELIK